MKCIYCKRHTSGAAGLAHVFPEAIVSNSLTLPRGSVCDACNNYLAKLDGTLQLHSHIALWLQLFRIRGGKRGEPRERIGYFTRSTDGFGMSLKRSDRFTVEHHENTLFLQASDPQGFDDARFRRA